MKFCTQCGKQAPDHSGYCLSCGAELPPDSELRAAAGGAQTPSGLPDTSGKAISSLICGLLFLFLPVAIVAVVLGHLSLSEIRRSGGRLKGSGMATAGLVLGYLGVSMIPILIIAAIAIPNLLRSKMATNEASAVGAMRTVSIAAITYSSTYRNGFPPSLGAVGGPAEATTPTCDHALFIDSFLSNGGVGNTSQKSGYVFTYVAGEPTPAAAPGCASPGAKSFSISAVPVGVGGTGQRGFFVDETGVIRFTTDGSVPSSESPPLQ